MNTPVRKFSLLAAGLMAAAYHAKAADAAILYVSDYNAGAIYTYSPGGVRSTFASGLSFPEGIAFDASGDLFVSDFGDDNIYRITPSGSRSTFAGGLGGARGLNAESWRWPRGRRR